MAPAFDREALQQRVEEALRRRKRTMRLVFFLVSLFLFILLNVVAWGILGAAGYSLLQGFTMRVGGVVQQTGEPVASAALLLMIGWALSLMFQGISLVLDTRAGEAQMRDQVTSRELNRAILEGELPAAMLNTDKPKRAMRLTDDGELQPADDAPADTASAPDERAAGR